MSGIIDQSKQREPRRFRERKDPARIPLAIILVIFAFARLLGLLRNIVRNTRVIIITF